MKRIMLVAVVMAAPAQTTDGLILGTILDSSSGRAIAGAQVTFHSLATNTGGTVRSGAQGHYALPLLPPGQYRLRVLAERYQPREIHQLDLPVAARLDITFRLRPMSDVWDARRYRSVFQPESELVVNFFGPDVDPSRFGTFEPPRSGLGALESTVSQVIDPVQMRELPLPGRDVYTMLVTQPGVTADAGTTRGLGLSINGQRPTASNFLLDGIENNNYLVTGPLTAIAPEAVQEYRVSTSSYSAEYGRTAGFVANAVTRSGGNAWHGIGYFHLKNESLNANGFRENLQGIPRTPLKESQPGFQVGGPLRRNSAFFSSSLDHLRSRSRAETENLSLPTTLLRQSVGSSTNARLLLDRFGAPGGAAGEFVVERPMAPPVSVDRTLLLERVDYVAGGFRAMGRLAIARLSRPDFIWSPYRDFVSGLSQNSHSLALGAVWSPRPSLTNEMRFGWSPDTLGWDRAHPEIPTLRSADGTVLPGSLAAYTYRNHSRTWEWLDNVLWVRNRHVFKAGGGFLLRRLDGFLTLGRDGLYDFDDYIEFARDLPSRFSVTVARDSLPDFALPRFDREYRYAQSHFFAQDAIRIRPRLTLNLGLRFENAGAPKGVYRAGGGAWAPRFGFSQALGRMVLRGSYGIFYDRPFDNLWQNERNNALVLARFVTRPGDYLAPAATALSRYRGERVAGDFPNRTEFEAPLRSAYSQSYFAGVQRQISPAWVVESNVMGALGRRLLTTDVIRRESGSLASYRGSQGISSYHALTALVRYRGRRSQLQAAYTWSHAIDLQSDALAGDFFDLSFTRLTAVDPMRGRAAFSREGDPRGDRGSADFDQRHNLVFDSIWTWRDWQFAQMAAFRTGFPYTVFAPTGAVIINNRADVLAPADADAPTVGGRRLLNASAFRAPSPDVLGNSGRNAFAGPGLYNVDLSLARTLTLRRWRLTIRADAFNVLNHANLNSPDSQIASESFGVALYGRRGRSGGFPALVPFQETARQLQMMLRVQF